MKQISYSEENYLKAIFKICSESNTNNVGTNELAEHLSVKPASANEMLKKLKDKELVYYEKYSKITLTDLGMKKAIYVVRKHRLWETFLYEKLDFSWDEVHEIAEELEHINSTQLIDKLDKFLGYPNFDPHGDPIPNKKGILKMQSKKTLNEVKVGETCKMVAVKNNSSPFLQYVLKLGLGINNKIKIISKQENSGQIQVKINMETKTVSQKFAENIFVV